MAPQPHAPREELARAAKITAELRKTVEEARDGAADADSRLKVLSRRKAAQALEGLTQQQLDEFRMLKLIRVPAPVVEWEVCSVCTLLELPQLNNPAQRIPFSAKRHTKPRLTKPRPEAAERSAQGQGESFGRRRELLLVKGGVPGPKHARPARSTDVGAPVSALRHPPRTPR